MPDKVRLPLEELNGDQMWMMERYSLLFPKKTAKVLRGTIEPLMNAKRVGMNDGLEAAARVLEQPRMLWSGSNSNWAAEAIRKLKVRTD